MKATFKHTLVIALPVVAVAALAAGSAQARDPFDKAELDKQNTKLLELVEQGYNLWHGSNPEMTSNGLACGNCHPDAGASNPQTFPKYIQNMNRVVQWGEMVNWCIQNPQAGKALALESQDMTAMYAYAMNLHRGLPIQPGLAAQQTKPIPVKYGKGFPSKPSGIGFDTK
jgi:thiosulfate dehydrogenase